MTDLGHPFYVEGAVIDGWAAYALARMVARHGRDEIADLPPHLRAPIEDAAEALQHAGARWAASVRGNAEALAAEMRASSESQDDELSTEEAADVLNMSGRRVRQLAATGALLGRQRAGRWHFDRRAVIAYHETKGTSWS